jgi:hypothetical protein
LVKIGFRAEPADGSRAKGDTHGIRVEDKLVEHESSFFTSLFAAG